MKNLLKDERQGHVYSVIDGKLVYMEDFIMEHQLGRPLKSTEMVIHKDGNPLNNLRHNLQLIDSEITP